MNTVHILLNTVNLQKKETLLNSIKSKFKVNNIDPEELFEELMKQGIIIVNENKITYIQQKLTEFASQ